MKKKRATLQVQKPEDIEFTITITMPLREWRLLREQLSKTWPSWALSSVITDCVSKATAAFSGKVEDAK